MISEIRWIEGMFETGIKAPLPVPINRCEVTCYTGQPIVVFLMLDCVILEITKRIRPFA